MSESWPNAKFARLGSSEPEPVVDGSDVYVLRQAIFRALDNPNNYRNILHKALEDTRKSDG